MGRDEAKRVVAQAGADPLQGRHEPPQPRVAAGRPLPRQRGRHGPHVLLRVRLEAVLVLRLARHCGGGPVAQPAKLGRRSAKRRLLAARRRRPQPQLPPRRLAPLGAAAPPVERLQVHPDLAAGRDLLGGDEPHPVRQVVRAWLDRWPPLYPRVWLRRDADVRRREEGRAAEGAVLPQAVDEGRLVCTRRRDDERPRGVSQKGLHGQPRAAVLGD
mmetsp:Transcript_34981/g.104484  ORF Transcript_34981/g.104484 Transcript_34981/m.104484 type:complete len:215 (-) Transcript_34981:354-998(-)